MTRWARAWLFVQLYLVPGNELRCGCHWHHRYGVVRAMGCPKHDQ
ncbi:hypothetical protein [Nonomuraea recticatena]